MSSYKLWELTKNPIEDLMELANTAASLIAQDENHYINRNAWDDDGEVQTLVASVHRVLWDLPKKPLSGHPPYTHELAEATSVTAALARAVGGRNNLDALFTRQQANTLAGRIYHILAGNQLLMRLGKGAWHSHYYIRAWPQGLTLDYYEKRSDLWLPLRDEVDIQRQEKKAQELAGPVTVYHSIQQIPLPKADAESVLDYVRKLVPLVRALSQENQELREQLAKQAEAVNNKWETVVDEITELLEDKDQ